MSQQRYWILTIPDGDYSFPNELPEQCSYLIGQRERGDGGYRHWQLLVHFRRAVRLSAVKRLFGTTCHAEPSRSRAAEEYVTKDETRIDGPYCLGEPLKRRNVATDWESIRDAAKTGDLDSIPANIFVQHYRTLRTIRSDYASPEPMERTVYVFWGRSGTGKSRRAWQEAGFDAYPKDPNTKFWDGYKGQENVVIDEFRGRIDISHVLRWLDRYPTLVEIKGSAIPLAAKTIWITSNLSPQQWYPELDGLTVSALLRRIEITEFQHEPEFGFHNRINE